MFEEQLIFLNRYLVYIILLLGFFVIPLLIIIGWMKFYRNKTVVELCRNIDGRFHIIKTIKIDNKKDMLTFKEKDYLLEYKFAVMKNNILNGHYATFRFDIEDCKPLKTDTNVAINFIKYSPTLLHRIIRTKIYSQILTGAVDSQFILIILIITIISALISVYSVYTTIQTQENIKMLISLLTKGVPTK